VFLLDFFPHGQLGGFGAELHPAHRIHCSPGRGRSQ
jgi:hypothetical protein